MDREKMERAVRLFLEGLGRGDVGDDVERTPARVARAWTEDLSDSPTWPISRTGAWPG